MAKKTKIVAILLGAGDSTRMNGIDKIIAPLLSRPLLEYGLERLGEAAEIARVVVVAAERNIETVRTIALRGTVNKIAAICVGGIRRQDSVRAGLEHVGDATHVLIHDGARPLVGASLIARAVHAASRYDAAIAAVPVKDTIKMADGNMSVLETVSRQGLWAVQTPQIFEADLLKTAHRTVKPDVTDDAAMVEMLGYDVKLFMGAYDNLKVTTPEDVAIAEVILRARTAVGVS